MKILGLLWHVEENNMTVTYHMGNNSTLSKRTVLSEKASIYDPPGLFSPVTLHGKLFLQTLWEKKMSWYQHLSEQDNTQWKVISQDLKEIPSHCFPR